jgi:hypothetical protein
MVHLELFFSFFFFLLHLFECLIKIKDRGRNIEGVGGGWEDDIVMKLKPQHVRIVLNDR